jgi:hypothetical protein
MTDYNCFDLQVRTFGGLFLPKNQYLGAVKILGMLIAND